MRSERGVFFLVYVPRCVLHIRTFFGINCFRTVIGDKKETGRKE